ncbi:hypothetical protein SH449x_001623 [Pirellulaceae bacterium SH449]
MALQAATNVSDPRFPGPRLTKPSPVSPELGGSLNEPSHPETVEKSDAVIERSEIFARILARRLPLNESAYSAFKNPLTANIPDNGPAAALALLGDLMKPSLLGKMSGTNKSFEPHAKFLNGLATCLATVQRAGQRLDKSAGGFLSETLLLDAILPIYLASSSESMRLGLESVSSKLRRAYCILGWVSLLEPEPAARWADLKIEQRHFLDTAIEQSFQISIPRIACRYWSLPYQPPGCTDLNLGVWDIACQIVLGENQLVVPKGMSLGLVSWEKILQHWNELKSALTLDSNSLDWEQNLATSTNSNEHHGDWTPDIAENADTVKNADTADAPSTDRCEVEEPVPAVVSSPGNSPEASITPSQDRRLVEIRSSSDPNLKKVLEQFLQRSREEQTTLAIAVVSRIRPDQQSSSNWFSPMIDRLVKESDVEDLKGFVTDAGELALMLYEVDRSEIANWLREAFARLRNDTTKNRMVAQESEELVAGVAMVNSPSRSFQLDQLIDAAWRCRDGAAIQGANAVKTIEVY